MFMMSRYAATRRLRTSVIALTWTCALAPASITLDSSTLGSPIANDFCKSRALFCAPLTSLIAVFSTDAKPPSAGCVASACCTRARDEVGDHRVERHPAARDQDSGLAGGAEIGFHTTREIGRAHV